MGRDPKLDGRKSREGGRAISFDPVQVAELIEPENFDEHAHYAWQMALKSLVPSKILAHGDVLSLEAACRSWGRWKRFEVEIAELAEKSQSSVAGELTKTPNGHLQMSALRISANQAFKEFMSVAKEFGLTPVSRVRTSGTAQGDLFKDLAE